MSHTRHQPATAVQPEITSGINPAIDVAQAVQRGEAPSTAQVAHVLQKSERALDEKLVNAEDEQTRTLVRDTQAALGSTKEFIESKDVGARLQTIYRESQLASQAAMDFPDAVGLTNEDKRILREMQYRLREGVAIGRDLLRSIIMDPSFRQALVEVVRIAYDIFYISGSAVMKDQPPLEPKKETKSKMETRAKQAKESAKESLKGKRTEAQRRELAERLRKLLQQLRDNDVYQLGVNNLFRLADLVKVSAEKASEKLEKMDVEIQVEPHTRKALEETKALAEEMLPGEKTLDPLIEKLKALVLAIRDDPKLTEHFRRWRSYVETSMKHPEQSSTDEFLKEGEELTDEALNLEVSSSLRDSAKEALDEWTDVLENFKQDEQLNMINVTMKKLMSDITKQDEQGRTRLDLDAISRFRPIVVELVRTNLDKIPLPDVVGENDTYQWKAWNLVASGTDIIPDFVHIESAIRSEAAIKDTNRPSWLQGDLIISVSNIRTKLDAVQFWYNRKTFPKGEDTGFIDIDVAGGINIVIKLTMEASDTSGGVFFSSGSVYCRADDVRVKLRDTKHDFLYNLFSGAWERPIKESIEKFVAKKLAGAIHEFRTAANERITEIQKASLAGVPEVLKQQITA